MSTTKHLLAVVFGAVALAAVSAAPAAALEVVEEGGEPCPHMTISDHTVSGGCHGLAVSSGPVEVSSVFGLMIVCDKQFEVRFDSTGAGYLSDVVLTNCNAPLEACEEPDGHSEIMSGQLTGSSNPWQLEVVMCVVLPTFGITINCHLAGITVNQISHTTGTAVMGTGSPPIHQRCENSSFNGVLATFDLETEEGEPGFEVIP